MEIKYLNDDEKKACELLTQANQTHCFANLTKHSDEERKKFTEQVLRLEATYPGGLKAYFDNCLTCLKKSQSGESPFEGFEPVIPEIKEVLNFNDENIDQFEALGMEELKYTVFVLIAGGLGERLGYPGIKVQLPFQLVTEECFLNYYIDYLMAFQKRIGNDHKMLLSIMTSDDTHDRTVKLLEENNYFGMPKDQISFMKQEKVPAIGNVKAEFSQKTDSLEIETKPHGHGDIHTLIHRTGNSKKWLEQGKKWICFFSDTNPLLFRAYPALLGVSKKYNLEMNWIGVPRKVGEAADVFVNLHKEGQKDKTFIIEWAYADVFFKPFGGEPVKPDGWSKYTTNINGLSFSLAEYHENLEKTKGLVEEFIAPKYADEAKTTFKSSARLETKMPDYPRLLENHDRFGLCMVERPFCFTTCKNDPKAAADKFKKGIPAECAGTCEQDFYNSSIKLLEIAGVEVEKPPKEATKTFAGIDYNFGPKVILKPSFGTTVKEIKSRFSGTNKISYNSTLILDGDIYIKNLTLDGSLILSSQEKKEFNDLTFTEKNYVDFVAIGEDEQRIEHKMRGFKSSGNENIKKL